MDAVIRSQALTKSYGARRGVADLDLAVYPGEVFGFLGPNGAGKTTTIRVLLDLLRPTMGRAQVLGLDSEEGGPEIRKRVGYLPGELNLPERITARTLLGLFARLRGTIHWQRFDALVARLQLDLDTRIGRLSRGNKQKVGLMQAFMHEPELLILDEPTSGLDPLLQKEFGRLVRETRAAGRTVFLSSHNLNEIDALCDRVAIIRDGRLVAIENVASLRKKQVRRFSVEFEAPVSARDFQGVAGMTELHVSQRSLECTVTGSPDALLKALARFHVVTLDAEPPQLEDLFLAHYQGRDPAAR